MNQLEVARILKMKGGLLVCLRAALVIVHSITWRLLVQLKEGVFKHGYFRTSECGGARLRAPFSSRFTKFRGKKHGSLITLEIVPESMIFTGWGITWILWKACSLGRCFVQINVGSKGRLALQDLHQKVDPLRILRYNNTWMPCPLSFPDWSRAHWGSGWQPEVLVALIAYSEQTCPLWGKRWLKICMPCFINPA